MNRYFAAVMIAFCMISPAIACEGQSGELIFEDKFKDDGGGWNFDGRTLKFIASEARINVNSDTRLENSLNISFRAAAEAEYCVEFSFPDTAIRAKNIRLFGLVFLATGFNDYWALFVRQDGLIFLTRLVRSEWLRVWESKESNLIKSGISAQNSVRAIVKDGSITAIINGRTLKTIRAQLPAGELMFGFAAEGLPGDFVPLRSFKVTTIKAR